MPRAPPTNLPEDLKVWVAADVLVQEVPVVLLHSEVLEVRAGALKVLLVAGPQLVGVGQWGVLDTLSGRRDGGKEGGREGEREGRREGGKEGGREGGRQRGRWEAGRGRERGREAEREGGREGGGDVESKQVQGYKDRPSQDNSLCSVDTDMNVGVGKLNLLKQSTEAHLHHNVAVSP